MDLQENKCEYPWDSLDTTTLVLPSELLVYYLYKCELDSKSKHPESKAKNLYQVKNSYFKLEGKEVKNVFQSHK